MRVFRGLSEDGKTHSIRLFEGYPDIPHSLNDQRRTDNDLRIMVIDTETTGLNFSDDDEIIDLAYVMIRTTRSGDILSIDKQYSCLSEPQKKPVTPDITRLTGITPEMVKGHQIDWECVRKDLEQVDYILAHNARFDRKILKRYLPLFGEKIWLCSMTQPKWREWGHFSSKLECLSRDHGFFYYGHRALIDCHAIVKLLVEGNFEGQPYLKYCLDDIAKEYVTILAVGAKYESKGFLKQLGFKWNGQNWYRNILKDSTDHSNILESLRNVHSDNSLTPTSINISRCLRFE